MVGLENHSRYDETYVMYLVVGHSSALRFAMSENLESEITRGLLVYMLGLSVVILVSFLIFAVIFVLCLRSKLTKPIIALSKQITNPQEFLANKDESAEVFAPSIEDTRSSVSTNRQSFDLSRNEPDTPGANLNNSMRFRSPRHMRKKITLDDEELAKQHEREDKLTGKRKVNEIVALRAIFYSFF